FWIVWHARFKIYAIRKYLGFILLGAFRFETDTLDTSLDHEEDDQEIDEPQSDINLIRKSSKTRRAPDRMCLSIDADEHELGDLGELANYKAALLDPESKKWLDAMNAEMQSMKDNDVWVLVELPPNARTVGSKWLFKKKTNMDGAVYIFKARLVAKGFTQTYRVDYEENFSPVADIRAISILIAIAAYYDHEIWQMDVKTAFLNGNFTEEVYMEQPEGFMNPKYPNHIYRDRSKRLIGLCQSAYIEKILKIYYMKNSKCGTIPMQEKLKLSKSQGVSTPAEKQCMQNVPYASTIRSIMYDVRCTRPDVAFAQNTTSRFQQNPEPISMHYDNTGAIAIAKDDGVTKGARHFHAKVHYLRETIKLGDVKIEKVDTDDNLADPFTKTLAFPKHFELTRNIGMLPTSSFM
nr:putative retrotransposon Ty1-copia subclass protein [Tanacetum cinerariifolium]